MKSLILLMLLVVGCGKDAQHTTTDITVMGDSIAAGVHYSIVNSAVKTTNWWTQLSEETSSTEGVSGATINYLLTKQDRYSLKTVIVFMGFNNLKHPEQNVNDIVGLYQTFLNRINAKKIICVGVPHVQNDKLTLWYTPYDDELNNRITQFNSSIKDLCENYVDTSDVDTVDGIHPEYELIIERIKDLL